MKNNGGAAFPLVAENPPYHVADGMSLRDYFAGQALVGLCSQYGYNSCNVIGLANMSYNIADAMLKEREKEKEASNVCIH